MSNKDLKYIATVKRNGVKWDIYTQPDMDDNNYIDIWINKHGLGIMDFVIGLVNDDYWRDNAAGFIIDFIDSTKGDPRYE